MMDPNCHRALPQAGGLIGKKLRTPTRSPISMRWKLNNLRRKWYSLQDFVSFSWLKRPDNTRQLPRQNLIPEVNSKSNDRNNNTCLHRSHSINIDKAESIEMKIPTCSVELSIYYNYIDQKGPSLKMISQLNNNVGTRVNKFWFIVQSTVREKNHLLTLMPLAQDCPLTPNSITKDALNKLFVAISHPYTQGVIEVDFFEYKNQTFIALIQPIFQGSLKDLIYGIEYNCWNEDWCSKYSERSIGLPLKQVQQIGLQILEALLFLKRQGFPPVTNMHSSNVLMQLGIAKLGGLENTILGLESYKHPIVTSQSTNIPLDVICFGHLLFEMCAGYELRTFRPSEDQLFDIKYPLVVNVLELIFNESENDCISLESLLKHDLFRYIDLPELLGPYKPILYYDPTLEPTASDFLAKIKAKH